MGIVNKDKKPDKPFAASAPEPEDAGAHVGPYNPALGEIYQRLYPEIKRPKPNQEAIAAALHAMQRLTMKMDSETAAEATAAPAVSLSAPCRACGHRNREGNLFCAMCGTSVDANATEKEALEAETTDTETTVAPSSTKLFQHSTHPQTMPEARTQAPPLPAAASASPAEEHPSTAPAPGQHHYHHHYHHHFFPAGSEAPQPASRGVAPESAREADRLRIAAAAKGEPISRSEAAVRRLTQEWVLACNTRQLDELLELYAPDALVLRSNLPLLRGASQVREFFFSALESGLGEVSLEPIRVEVLGDLAHEVGRYSALVPGTTGKRREERGKYLWVFAKQSGGEWKLISECWSADLTLTNAESDLPKATPQTFSRTARK